jgi:2-amino-4-hydroxy-6-hydroxymethyldihydropteridine diphosphokinase
MDKIIIRDLLVRCIIGLNEDERREKQDVIINAVLFTDLSGAGASDEFEDTVDYRSIKKKIYKAVVESEYFLIEALAEKVAGLCLEPGGVRKVVVTVDKPGALRFAKSVAVEITREKASSVARVFIAVGSNIAQEDNVKKALAALNAETGVLAVSTFYLTEPVDRPGQPPFYNGIVEISTDLTPLKLRDGLLRPIEERLGRVRSADKHAPRTIDLDVVLYDSIEFDSEGLIIPDPEITERPFLAVPLAELAPDVKLPVTDTLLKDISERFRGHAMEPLTDFTESLRGALEAGR